MERRNFIKLAGVAAFSAVQSSSMAESIFASENFKLNKKISNTGSDKPNFLFIMADDCTYRDIGCYGGQAHTPNIDKLVPEGMKFTNCFQAAPMCSPTRHNIYTGLYPVKSGAYPNHAFAKEGTKSIVHYLKPLGYRVALSGKTHIAPDEVFPFEYSGSKNPDMGAVESLFSECKDTQTPFCLFACSNEPHTPWNKGNPSAYDADEVELRPYIPDTPVVRESMTKYLAEITYFDNQVGQLLNLLDEYGLSDNTMVMVVSEQGNALPFAKWTCYEDGLGSIMIVRWPGKVEAGSISEAIVEYVDVTPTFIEAAGGNPPEVLDGKSMLGLLTGKTKEHKDYTFGIHTSTGILKNKQPYPIRSVRDENYRLIWNLMPNNEFQNVTTENPSSEFQSMLDLAAAGDEHAQKYTHKYQHRPEFELYNIKEDPANINNLADEPGYEEVFKRLKTKLDEWMQDQGDRGIQTELNAYNHQI
ncbi:Choline-sulfatase [Sedimentisphaera cyanobacteriorum]|uniref:Choline-sulfatase n=1 Tax=Sedimentisphaera cyanobacteriorum TaxID=1940790 RepID=A0A1Q2HQ75_9BACT|nr:sulfatase [Sedimentisphaera cyanobacteriorum]AQQ09510.1 Choline-sulfatase [Sedimentisphaera cyanobacteriorum]